MKLKSPSSDWKDIAVNGQKEAGDDEGEKGENQEEHQQHHILADVDHLGHRVGESRGTDGCHHHAQGLEQRQPHAAGLAAADGLDNRPSNHYRQRHPVIPVHHRLLHVGVTPL
jgi:hypothetical protein